MDIRMVTEPITDSDLMMLYLAANSCLMYGDSSNSISIYYQEGKGEKKLTSYLNRRMEYLSGFIVTLRKPDGTIIRRGFFKDEVDKIVENFNNFIAVHRMRSIKTAYKKRLRKPSCRHIDV